MEYRERSDGKNRFAKPPNSSMKMNCASTKRGVGSVLIIGLIVTAILIATMLSYLSLIHRQNMAVARSQAWNAALAIAESGVEEALAQLNPGALSNSFLGGSSWSINGNFYEPNVTPRTMAGGYYAVVYTPNPPPVIYSTGYARIPAIPATIKRAIEVKTTNSPLFGIGMVSRLDIKMNGHNIKTDSYTNSIYTDANVRSNGDLATTYGNVTVGSATIYGSIYTSPAASATWNNSGYVSGGVHNDFNMEFPDILPPYTGGKTPTGSGTNTYLLTPTNPKYIVLGNLSLKNDEVLRVSGTGKVQLYVTGNFSMIGNSQIVIDPAVKLELFVGGSSAKINKVENEYAANFIYYGLASNTLLDLGGNNTFKGSIYAPSADFTLNGGGNDTIDFQGALVVKSLNVNGHFNLHYDESLKFYGPFSGYKAISWREIPAD
jgi:hypothetical protein